MTPEELQALKAEFAALDDAALTAEYERIRTRGQELAAKADADFTEEERAEFSALAARIGPVQEAITERTAAIEAANATRESFATLPEAALPTAVVPTAVQKADENAPVPVSEPVSAPAVPVPSVGDLSAQTPVQPPPGRTVRRDTVRAELSAQAASLLGLKAGDEYGGDNNIGMALIKNAQSFGFKGAPGQRQTMAQFKRDRGAELTVDTGDGPETMRILRHARNEKRLEGGSLANSWMKSIEQGASLTAAAGWCAPSENDYDLCRGWDAPVGILDLPSVTVTRGGINYTDDPDFPTIYANAVAAGGGSNFLTEAQVIADTAKTCSEIPCPTFENRRLDVLALCIRVSFLQAAGYPEVVDAWDAGLRAAHEAEMNRIIIADIIARAGAATTLTPPDPDVGDSWTSGLLAGIDLAAEDIRYRFHMAFNATIEIVLPHWVLLQIRADLSRRSGGFISVTDAEIAQWFAIRNVRVQFVRGWQDGLITGGALNAAFPGGDAAAPFMVALPTGVSFLAYPAGSVAVARQDVVTLTNVYDAASLAVNEFTSLFAEEGFAPIYPCPGQRLYTLAGLCNAGTTGASNIDCVDAA
jgi:hypothetical protein